MWPGSACKNKPWQAWLTHVRAQNRYRLDHPGTGRAPLRILVSGRYRSICEVMRSALRLMERDEAAAFAAIGSPVAHGEPNRG